MVLRPIWTVKVFYGPYWSVKASLYSLRKRKSADAGPLPVSSSQGTFTQDVIPWTTYAELKVINKEQLYLYAFVSM